MPVRIYDISKKLGVENKEVLSKAKELGIAAARVASSSLDKITAEYLEEQLKQAHPELSAPPPPAAAPLAPVAEPVVLVAPPPVVEPSVVVSDKLVEPPKSPVQQEATTVTATSTAAMPGEPPRAEEPVAEAQVESSDSSVETVPPPAEASP